jgi:hypothetical protein
MVKHLTRSEHHSQVAICDQRTAVHRRLVSQHYAEKGYAHAAHQALIAHGHSLKAIYHANEAMKYQLEHHDDEADFPSSGGIGREVVQ